MSAPTEDQRDGLAEVFERERPQKRLEMGTALSGLQQRLFGKPRRVLTLSRYVLLHRLGGGGGGVVYAAYDPELDRRVAIKLLRSRKDTAAEQELRSRLQREAQAMAKLSHPNVIAVHDVGTYDESALAIASGLGGAPESDGKLEIPARGVFVVMELVDGPNLARWLDLEERGSKAILDVFVAAGRGLSAAHQRGLVHRDFKPTNVLVGTDGRVRVLDFGLARTIGDPEPSTPTPDAARAQESAANLALSTPLTERGTIMGTPRYMSPEQHRAAAADARSDQYSFCVALYEALHGGPPFHGDKLEDLANAKDNCDLAPVPESAKVPAWIRSVLLRGLSPQPDDRYPSMGQLLADLQRDPATRRRRVAAGIGAVALIGAVFGVLASREPPEAACRDQAARLAGVWDADTQALVHQAFSATDLPYSDKAWTSVKRLLDEYTDSWVDSRTDACAATVVRREQPAEDMDARMLCLDRKLERVAGLTRLFTDANRGVVESAVDSVAALEPIHACANPSTAYQDDFPQEGPQRDALLKLERELTQAEAMHRAGEYAEGTTLAEAALASARALGHGASEARASLILGRLTLGSGDAEESERHLVAAWVAAERIGEHQLATRSLIELIRVIGYDQARPSDAQRYIDLALAKIGQRDLGDSMRGLLLRNIATVRWREGKYKDTFGTLEEARALFERALGPEHPRVAEVLGSMGAMYAAQGEYEKSLKVLLQAMPMIYELVGPQHPAAAALHQNLGATYYAMGKHDESVEHYREALAIFEATVGMDHPSVGSSLSNLGITLIYEARYDEARELFNRALQIKESTVGPDHPSVAATLNNLGACESELGNHQRALELHERALEIRRKALGESHVETAQSMVNLGYTLHVLGRSREGLEPQRRGVALLEAENMNANWLVDPLRGIGETLLGLGRRREAIDVLERSVRLGTESDAKPVERAMAEFSLARAVADANPQRARELATKAKQRFAGAPGRDKKIPEIDEWLRTQEK